MLVVYSTQTNILLCQTVRDLQENKGIKFPNHGTVDSLFCQAEHDFQRIFCGKNYMLHLRKKVVVN